MHKSDDASFPYCFMSSIYSANNHNKPADQMTVSMQVHVPVKGLTANSIPSLREKNNKQESQKSGIFTLLLVLSWLPYVPYGSLFVFKIYD